MLEYTVLHWRADTVSTTNFRWYPVDKHKSMLSCRLWFWSNFQFSRPNLTFSQPSSLLASQAQLLASQAQLLSSQAQLLSSQAQLLASQPQLLAKLNSEIEHVANTCMHDQQACGLLHTCTSRSILLLHHGRPCGGASKKKHWSSAAAIQLPLIVVACSTTPGHNWKGSSHHKWQKQIWKKKLREQQWL